MSYGHTIFVENVFVYVNRRVKTERSSRGKHWGKMTEYSCMWMALKWCFESRKTLSSLFLFTSSLSSDVEGTRWHWVSACVFHVSCFDSHALYHKHCEHASLYKFSRCLCLTDKRIMHIQQIFESYVMKLYKGKSWPNG